MSEVSHLSQSDSLFPGCGTPIGLRGHETTCGDRGVCSRCWSLREIENALRERIPMDYVTREVCEAVLR